jgi:hypothetical protein
MDEKEKARSFQTKEPGMFFEEGIKVLFICLSSRLPFAEHDKKSRFFQRDRLPVELANC